MSPHLPRIPDPRDLDPAALIGQLICVVLRDYDGEPEVRLSILDDFERHGWGGIIVFGGELSAIGMLLADLRLRSPIPLLIAGDFERGFGQQFPADGTVFPPLMALGAAGDAALARETARTISAELLAHGFHVNFAPVADLASEPGNPIVATRSAGADPEAVSGIVRAFVEGAQSEGIAAAVKHFPGHARTTLDSHSVLPVVEADRSRLEESDLRPFRAGIEAGARLVMSAHVAFPALEPDGAQDRPATFSRAILTDLLRREWGFGGCVVSDALMMGAIAGESPEIGARRALEAGVDWLLYPPDPPAVHAGLLRVLASGELDRDRCVTAAGRVLELKAWAFGSTTRRGQARISRISAAPLAEAVAGAAITARPGEPPAGPGWPDRAQWVVILDGAIDEDDVILEQELGAEAARSLIVVDTSKDPAVVRAGIEAARIGCRNAWTACAVFSPVRAWKERAGLSEAGREAVAAACGEAREAVVVIFSSPWIASELSSTDRIVWAYGEDAACQRAALAFLRGALPATGRLPVEVRGPKFDRGLV